MNNITTKMTNILEKISSRVIEAEEQMRELEDRVIEITTVE